MSTLSALAATAEGALVPIEVSIEDLAHLIRELTPEQRVELAAELTKEPARKPRCPSRDPGGTAVCVRDEDHEFGPHVGADGSEWIIAIRCQIGATNLHAVCDRIEGHEPPCRPLDRPGADAAPAMPVASAPRAKKGPRGVCQCGKPRQDHDGPTKTGGCAASCCAKYKSAIR